MSRSTACTPAFLRSFHTSPRPRRWLRPATVLVAAGATLGALSAPAALAAAPGPPSVLHVGQISRQDVPVLTGSEPDTLVEPDIGVSPKDSRVALAAAHDGRYPDGGAVGISYAWTHDGGRTWHHQPLPGVTATTGGEATWERASDPVVAFGPDGAAYISTLVFNSGCDSAVLVSRSTDGGRTFGAPVAAHRSATCDVSDDKNWLAVDNSPTSPHRGRLYQFWTPFLTDIFGNADGSPQALVWSDDHGMTWSKPVNVSPPHANTQNSQPMILANGRVVDAFIDYGANAAEEGPEAQQLREATHRSQPRSAPRAQAAPAVPVFRTVLSTDGGRSWKPGGAVTKDLGDGAPGFRCCLPSTTTDPVTSHMYAVWNSANAHQVKLSSSTDGSHWTAPVVVNQPTASLVGVNADVAAYGGTVSVSYGMTNADTSKGRFGRQFVATSRDSARHFLTPTPVGPQINYAYAAFARGIFPGDYVGSAMAKDRLYAAWCVSSKPPVAGAKYHQVLYAATFDTNRSPVRAAGTLSSP